MGMKADYNWDIRNNKIDDGSCEGYLFDHLRDVGFKNLYGIDISPDAIEKLKKRGYNGEVLDIHKSTIKEKYGIMISSHSLEHCHNPKLAVDNMYKALKIGGRLLVVVPNQYQTNGDIGIILNHLMIY